MLFNSFIFFFFLAIVLPLYYYLPRKFKNSLLLFSSYFFYAYWDWRFTFLLALSTIVDYFLGTAIFKANEEKNRKFFLTASLLVNLSILGFFKYFGFFISSFEALGSTMGIQFDYLHLNIILPVGISFYTFQTMSYTIDIYRKKLQPTNNFIDFAVFVSFFPQLVAGPIERAKNLLPQISKALMPTKVQIQQGFVLIVTGLFIKVMIGDTTGRIVDQVFGNIESYKSVELISALILFSIQLYADFSGYSSIARGVAKLLGIELMKNFEQPYLSSNISEFWRRWHISLSSWLKDYLYIPLGGNRIGVKRTYINLLLTMLLGGLWHGASFNFILWGGLHGLYLAIHKYFLFGARPTTRYFYNGKKSFLVYLFKVLSTYILVLFTYLFFRAADFETIQIFISKMLSWETSQLSFKFIKITFVFLFTTIVLDILMYYTKSHTYILLIKNKGIKIGILASLFLITLLYMFQSDPLPFVYFQF